MRLAEFIRREREEILEQWVAFAKTILPAAKSMSDTALRDHAREMLEAVAADMEQQQSREEQTEKSHGRGDNGHEVDAVGQAHAVARFDSGFDLDQMVSEYRALRASVIRLWESKLPATLNTDRGDLTRFNEAIDQALTESVKRYTNRVERYRDLFLGVLGHDLRNPLGAITMSATFLSRADDLSAKHAKSASRILSSCLRMGRMVDVLLDLTRSRLGGGIPLRREKVELRALFQHGVDELEAFHPDRHIELEPGDLVYGEWDGDRITQVLSNLVANALQHGEASAPVTVKLSQTEARVVFEVHNEGVPIPERARANLFEPMVRQSLDAKVDASGNLGLGLYIVREIVTAHGGEVRVASSLEGGTTFTVELPKAKP